VRRAIHAPGAPAPVGPYSPGLVAPPFLFVASQGPLDPATGAVVGTDAATQARQVFANIAAICADAGASLGDVVRVQLYLADLDELDAVNAVYRESFPEPFPARSILGVRLPGVRVAAEATVLLPGGPAAGSEAP
jgi:reactive intermediate/imine deaminase